AGDDVARAGKEPRGGHARGDGHHDQVIDDLAGEPDDNDENQPSQRGEGGEALLLTDVGRHDAEDGQRHERDDPEQDLHEQLAAGGEGVDDGLDGGGAPGALAVADLDEGDADGDRQDDKLGDVVGGEGLADALGDELLDELDDGLARGGRDGGARL